jgi:hypothetical protein
MVSNDAAIVIEATAPAVEAMKFWAHVALSSRRSVKRYSTPIRGCASEQEERAVSESARVNVSPSCHFVRPVLIFRYAGGVLNWYRFIGRILGKAMYEGILVDVAFTGFFLAGVGIIIRCVCSLRKSR